MPLARRTFCRGLLAATGCAVLGCDAGGPALEPDLVWGRRGIAPGRLWKPRAMTIDRQDRLYIVDFTARIQVYDTDGAYLRGWSTPIHKAGRPTGLSVEGDQLLVADTHYFRVLRYTLDGSLLEDQTLGGVAGNGPGEFGFVTDAVCDATGAVYVSEYGDYDRVQKFSPRGEFLLQWGSHGDAPGQFVRPQSLLVDPTGTVWVADACNHRIQAFDPQGKHLRTLGAEGDAPGQLRFPYGLAMDPQGNLVVCEYGNHRVQKLSPLGEPLGVWGTAGRAPGQLFNPWAVALDSRGRTHILDTYNHRVQRVIL